MTTRPALRIAAACGTIAAAAGLFVALVGIPQTSVVEGGEAARTWSPTPAGYVPFVLGVVIAAGAWRGWHAVSGAAAIVLLAFSVLLGLGVGGWFLPFALVALAALAWSAWDGPDAMAGTLRRLRRG